MRILKILRQYRRDFTAVLVCERCANEQDLKSGYDDRNYHDNVIPKIKCEKCGKSREDMGITADPTPTRYADFEIV